MPLVSVTRFRARSLRFVPLFIFHANRMIAQIRKSEGFLAGTVQRDADQAFWTMTIWRDERAMHAFVASDAHRNAMPHLRDWSIEASVVRWEQKGAALPDWNEVIQRMQEGGRASPLRHPGPQHARLGFRAAPSSYGMRF